MKYNEKILQWGLEKRKAPRTPKRVLIKKDGSPPAKSRKGIVEAAKGNVFLVKDESLFAELVECVASGTIISPHENTSIICVGDRVWFELDSRASEKNLLRGRIVKVEFRRTKLSRRAPGKYPMEHAIASNADRLAIVSSIDEPKYNKKLIDRYLIAAQLGFLKFSIVVNKIDLGGAESAKSDLKIYEELGVDLFFLSAETGDGTDAFVESLRDKTTIFAGQSGSGKSTLLNRILGEEIQSVGEISEKTRKGRHTTSFVKSFDYPELKAKIIDTPGAREFGVWDLDPEDLKHFFPEIKSAQEKCKFASCTHTHEPKCAVKAGVEAGEIDPERYESYFSIFCSLEENA